MFDNLDEALYWLEHKKKKHKREDLSRMNELLKILNLNNLDFKIIHIAGTNGKGSTAININNLLLSLNYKVGLFTSPYIVKFNERIMINNNYISDEELLNLINYIYPIILEYENKNDDLVPFFEILFLICLIYFKNQKIDYAVIETGIGGLLDATNVVKPIASIITSIGYDHMASLGDSILDIAKHKAGIIKENTPVFTITNGETDDYLKEVANNKNSKLFILKDYSSDAKIVTNGTSFTYDDFNFITPLFGLFQANNASLAIAFMKYFFNITNEEINKGLSLSYVPGRFEKINNFILDGAHNISATLELVKTIKTLKLNHLTCIFSSLKDKRYDLMLKVLDEVVDTYIFPKFADLRQVEPETFTKYTSKETSIATDISEAITKCKNITLITGSLHFVSACRKKILG